MQFRKGKGIIDMKTCLIILTFIASQSTIYAQQPDESSIFLPTNPSTPRTMSTQVTGTTSTTANTRLNSVNNDGDNENPHWQSLPGLNPNVDGTPTNSWTNKKQNPLISSSSSLNSNTGNSKMSANAIDNSILDDGNGMIKKNSQLKDNSSSMKDSTNDNSAMDDSTTNDDTGFGMNPKSAPTTFNNIPKSGAGHNQNNEKSVINPNRMQSTQIEGAGDEDNSDPDIDLTSKNGMPASAAQNSNSKLKSTIGPDTMSIPNSIMTSKQSNSDLSIPLVQQKQTSSANDNLMTVSSPQQSRLTQKPQNVQGQQDPEQGSGEDTVPSRLPSPGPNRLAPPSSSSSNSNMNIPNAQVNTANSV